jgi:hypothetical protein
MAVKTYDPKEVTVTYGGYDLNGFSDGTKVTVEFNEDAWTLQVGVDGEGTRSKSNNRSGRVTIQLMQSSDSNEIMTGISELDRLSNAGALPLMVKDSSGTSIHTAETAWIVKSPMSEYGVEAGPREWILETDILVSFVGKN